MLATARVLNLAVRFAVELALLAAVATAAWHLPGAPALRWISAVTAVLAVSTGWVLVVHDERRTTRVRVGAQAGALAIGFGCLLWLDAPSLAAALTVIALTNAVLLTTWEQ